MARYLVATHRATLKRDWLCKHCQAFGHATVSARGSSEKRLWFSRDAAASAAHERAAIALDRDADRIVSLIRCPTCRKRALGAALATLWHGLGDLPTAVVGAAVVGAVVAGYVATWFALPAAAIVMVAILAIGDERRRWREAARAHVEVSRRRPPVAPARAPTRPSESLSGDPFRAPPALPPLAVVRPLVQTQTPVVTGDPSDKPKFLL
jgi:hypothetical protein